MSDLCRNKNWEKYDELQYTDLQHYHITKITTLENHFLTKEALKGSPKTTYETRTLYLFAVHSFEKSVHRMTSRTMSGVTMNTIKEVNI